MEIDQIQALVKPPTKVFIFNHQMQHGRRKTHNSRSIIGVANQVIDGMFFVFATNKIGFQAFLSAEAEIF